jgi:hypothetical protein
MVTRKNSQKRSSKATDEAQAQVKGALTPERIEELVHALVPPDGDAQAHALVELLASIAREPESHARANMTDQVVIVAFRSTRAFADAMDAFTADIPRLG